MALDKQMILNELGSVMNKLQSADCGCMGKLFSNQGQNQGGQGAATMGSPLPTFGGCRRGYCHGHGHSGHNHGYSAPCAGEPCSMHSTPCMGMQCNPHKMYADTYNYLNSNFMQPVVNEVYQDLKSINPSNSVMNNPMASKLGLQQPGGAGMPGNMGMAQNQAPGSDMGGNMQDPNMAVNHQMGGQPMSNQQMASSPISHVGGMGPNIVNMMQGDGKTSGKTSQLTPLSASTPQAQVPGGMGQYNAEMTPNTATYGGQQAQSQYMQQSNINNPMNPNSQSARSGNMQQNTGYPGAAYQVNYSNPAAQQMSANRNKPNYGQHTPGITKFNEMFPGVTGGDLGFDPMSIAIQMNPANHQQAAMGQMQKIMNTSPHDKTNAMQSAIAGTNAAAAAMNPPLSQQNGSLSSQPMSAHQQVAPQQNLHQSYTNAAANQPNQAQQQVYSQVPQQQQQVYTAVTGAPTMNQNQPQHQQLQPQQYQQQPQQYQQQPQQYQQQPPQQYQQLQNVDPNAQQYQQQQSLDLSMQGMSPPNLPIMHDGHTRNADRNQQPPQSYNNEPPTSDQMVKEPIFPVDTSRNLPPHQMSYQKHYEYNTLGQPVQMLPAKMFHPVPDNNPQQTLSPQPITKMRTDQSRFVVKNTVSKTSLMGARPVGRTPSRGQLQQIYNQYKGSHSYTQQNIRSPGQGATFSEGKINVANANQHRHVPVERVGGDTLANNQMINNPVPVKGQPMGDVPVPVDNKPHGDIAPANEVPIKKTRNGLQDLVYTSYPTSAAWSFHGNSQRQSSSHPSTGYRRRA